MTPSANPLVTVICPAYNAGDDLEPSVRSILDQTHRDLELIVVDDGSVDGSVDRLEASVSDPRLRILRQPNGGKGAAMNNGIAHARGEFYAVQDSDDISHPTRIARQLDHLVRNPDLTGCFCGWDLILDGRRTAPQHRFKDAEQCRRDLEALRIPTHDGTPMFRIAAVEGVHYIEGVRTVESTDYLYRLHERGGRFEVLGELLYSYRIRADSMCHADPSERIALVAWVRDAARERRGLPPETHAARLPRSRNAARDNNLASYFMESVLDQRRAGERVGALRTALRCAAMHPLDPHYLKPLAYGIAPRGAIRRVRQDPALV
jgi:glycosyltransferase involved in cell wall biosynthesis